MSMTDDECAQQLGLRDLDHFDALVDQRDNFAVMQAYWAEWTYRLGYLALKNGLSEEDFADMEADVRQGLAFWISGVAVERAAYLHDTGTDIPDEIVQGVIEHLMGLVPAEDFIIRLHRAADSLRRAQGEDA